MSNLNKYLSCGPPTLPVLPVDSWCAALSAPLLSQIKAVLMLPVGLNTPDDWTVKADVEGVIGNETVGNSTGKWLVGFGEVPEPEEVTATLGRVKKIHCRNKYTLLLNMLLSCEENYSFLRSLQGNWTGFRFWFYTVGGRFIGGATGIEPSFVRPTFSYGSGASDIERATLRIEWDADGDAPRTYLPGLFGNTIQEQTANFQVAVYRQNYSAQAGAQLIWTTNGGDLNAPYANNLWVLMNGQKLNPDLGQYTVTAGTGPGQSTITIDALTHYSGANYEVYNFVPAT